MHPSLKTNVFREIVESVLICGWSLHKNSNISIQNILETTPYEKIVVWEHYTFIRVDKGMKDYIIWSLL